MQANGGPVYEAALCNGHLATLCTLRRVGVPWQPAAEDVTRLVASCSVPSLACLLAEGCLVKWRDACSWADIQSAGKPVALGPARGVASTYAGAVGNAVPACIPLRACCTCAAPHSA
jgi:hypothetical protein